MPTISAPVKRGRKRAKKKPNSADANNYYSRALAFAKDAAADQAGIRHCKYIRQAAQRHLDDLERQKTRSFGYYFSEEDAQSPCWFIEQLPHVEGSWATKLLRLEPSQLFILCCVFGWRNKSDDNRRFSTVYIEMARKGAKSTLSAGVALYCLTMENEVGPQVICAATTGEQAQKVFSPARLMVDRSPDIRDACGLEVFSKSIMSHQNGGYIQSITSKGKAVYAKVGLWREKDGSIHVTFPGLKGGHVAVNQDPTRRNGHPTLFSRLDQLLKETPTDTTPKAIQVNFVSADGTSRKGPRFEIDNSN